MRVPNIHFDPESRQLQTARLEHLLSFSDLLLLLIAEPGLGRSHLLNHLRPEQSPVQPHWVQLTPDASFDVTHLLQALIAQLGLSCEPNNRSRLTALHSYAQALEQVEQQLVICIDDADFLTDNALELLINFSKVDSAAPKVLLSALPEFEQRFYDREFNRLVEGTLHIEHLQPYTAEEARAFVDAHLLDGRVLKDSEYRRLLNYSQGRPDQLKVALAGLLDSSSPVKSESSSTNRWYWAGIALVLGTVGTALAYLYYPDASTQEDLRRPVEIAVPQVQPANSDVEPQLVEARSELARRLAEQEARLAEVAQETEQVRVPVAVQEPDVLPSVPASEPSVDVTEVAEVQVGGTSPEAANPIEPVKPEVSQPIKAPEVTETSTPDGSAAQLPPGAELSSPQELPSNTETGSEPGVVAVEARETAQAPPRIAEPQKQPEAKTKPQSSGAFSAAIEEVLAWPASHLTVQLIAAREQRSADQLIAKHASVNGLLKLSYPYQGSPRYTVVYGHFATRALADAAVKQLPASLQKLKPWIRSVAGLKAELNQGLNP